MTGGRERPPKVGDEKTNLLGWLDLQRSLIPWKCEGLSDVEARRVVLPDTSPGMTMGGLVSHLRWTEHCWFEVIFLGRGEAENPQFDESLPEDADWELAAGVPLERLI